MGIQSYMEANSLENLLQNLTETLDKMIITYKDILQVAQEKKRHIISGDIDKLESIIYQERNLAENVLLLEEKRRYIMHSISQAIGKDNTSLRLSELTEQIRDPYKSELKKQYDIITEIITKVEDVNRVNTSLTKYSLEFVNNLIKSVCTVSLNDSIYQQSGKLKDPELKRMLFETSA
ncbi:MAG: flagella synthesis protein FlgN [Candidatus Scalindua rubra]|uniref:Flagella synthesis protein FlgN n=1 Tax=Candidatus Scalindua rubra TaxID=1872076 RepID=A0A1E3X965_9BACT|nr:MAG: flagella synthesis protein FlgN [Candidatus Scalindua rubra]